MDGLVNNRMQRIFFPAPILLIANNHGRFSWYANNRRMKTWWLFHPSADMPVMVLALLSPGLIMRRSACGRAEFSYLLTSTFGGGFYLTRWRADTAHWECRLCAIRIYRG
ncbi:hypothetical protein [Musicola paradisiaca]|uniref:hypothetical protein n=1 Tax=Musicola paradisiaca TaxID=69223 RepID=UPI0018849744|nr:hypothetical protein [Musicola paradisiaca]